MKNKDLLEFPKSERDAYLTGAILSTAHTLSIFHSKDMGQCFSDWFLENPDVRISEMEGIYAEKSKSCAIKHFTGTASAQMRQVKTEVSS